ncbi:DUF2332 domain-containing protein [Actinospica durhamensis]|uniref:DUF2332 domain-containing protein n=1 Tax=Actinospica durhamensis TaxID=1508375 RepID=A0A941ESZ6_9ACTN|nr:DUF2332 domain-containing protein [Actinospica durhamensis]MBR7833284.1 DUF2332 domain-containing protein [Actinospica durhamensis]
MPDTLSTSQPTGPDALAARFRHFAAVRTGAYAPLYAVLGAVIAEDQELLTIAAHAPSGQSAPDLMLAAVHYLLAETPEHRLAGFYPTLTRTPAPPGAAGPALREFALARSVELKTLIGQRTVQTNEVRRCAYLLPALQLVAALTGGRELALIEAGTSAGLNLLIDRYAYRYGLAPVGDPSAELVLDCEPRGPYQAPITLPALRIAWRAGLDLNPLDANDPADQAWLSALVWPDHPQRLERLRAATRIAARCERPRFYTGDAAATLPAAIADAPVEHAVCLMHTAFLAHLPPTARERFEQLVPQLSADRPIYWIHAEPRTDPDEPRLQLSVAVAGHIEATWRLADYHPHGEWIAWSGTDPVTIS